MTDLLPSLMRHQCTIVHHLPYAHIPVTGTSVHTATYDISHDDSAHFGATTHNVMVDDSKTYGGTFTSPIVLEDSSTYDSATHALVVPSASDQYVITDSTSYDRVRNYSIQYPNGYSISNRPWYSIKPYTVEFVREKAEILRSLSTIVSR